MYCSKCGKEIRDGDIYCGVCGTKVNSEHAANTISGPGPTAKRDIIMERLGKVGEDMKVYLLCVLLPILSMLFMGNNMFEVSYDLFGYSNTLEYTMFEGKDFIKIIFYIGYIVAAGMLVLPLIQDTKWELKHFAVGIGMPIASAILFAVSLFSVKNEVATGQYASVMSAIDVKVAISINAWLFLIISAVMALMTYKAYVDMTNTQERKAREEWKPEESIEVMRDDMVKCPKCGKVQPKGAMCNSCYAPLFKL